MEYNDSSCVPAFVNFADDLPAIKQICFAGVDYIVLTENGSAYVCSFVRPNEAAPTISIKIRFTRRLFGKHGDQSGNGAAAMLKYQVLQRQKTWRFMRMRIFIF